MITLAFDVRAFQGRGSLDVGIRHHLHEAHHVLGAVLPMAVEVLEESVDGVEVRAEAGIEVPEVLTSDFGLEAVEYFVQQGMRDLFVHGSGCDLGNGMLRPRNVQRCGAPAARTQGGAVESTRRDGFLLSWTF